MISGEVSSSAVNVILLGTAVTSAGRGTRRDTGERTRGRTWVCTDSPLTRTECALVNLSSRKNFPHRAWFLARACLRVQEEGYNVMDRINNKSARCFGDLMDHYEDVTSDQNKLEQDFSRLLRTGRLDSPSLDIPGYLAPASSRRKLPYRECGTKTSLERTRETILGYGGSSAAPRAATSALCSLLAVSLWIVAAHVSGV